MSRSRHAIVALATLLSAPSTRARADDKQACIQASDDAQEQRSAGRLLAARASLLTCVREACPAPVRQFCEGWLREVDASVPSVIVRVTDAGGHDLVEVRVLVDGRLVAASLSGRPLPVDPGVRVFRFEPKGAPAFEDKLVVVESEKNRLITETAQTAAPAIAEPQLATAAPVGAPAVDAKPSRGVPTATWVLGAVGVVSIGAFGTFTAVGASAYSECVDHACSASKRDSLRVTRALAWTSLGVGVVALGAAGVIWSTGRSADGTGVALRIGPEGGAGVAWTGRF